MSIPRRATVLIISLLLVVGVACGPAPSTEQSQPSPPLPTSQPAASFPTAPLQTQRPQAVVPSPSPGLTEVERDRLNDFATAYVALMKEWDAFQANYEQWRLGLTECDEAAMRQALRRWATQFSTEVTPLVHLLRPSGGARPAADLLSEALTKEEVALRRLSGSWKSGDTPAFLEFEVARAEANAVRRKATYVLEEARSGGAMAPSAPARAEAKPPASAEAPKDTTTSQQEGARSGGATAPSAPAGAEAKASASAEAPKDKTTSQQVAATAPVTEAFAKAFGAANEGWDTYQRSYDSWRQLGGDCKASEVTVALRALVQRFQATTAGLAKLPYSPTVASVIELTGQAAETEERALKSLRDTWQPYNLQYFVAFEEKKGEAERLRRQAVNVLATLQINYAPSSSAPGAR